jgi:hypothetical protein
MTIQCHLQVIGLLTLVQVAVLPPALTQALAQFEKQAPPVSAKNTRPNPADRNSNLPACDKFQDWSYGQQCRRNDGKTCQVMGQRADPGELKFCK